MLWTRSDGDGDAIESLEKEDSSFIEVDGEVTDATFKDLGDAMCW